VRKINIIKKYVIYDRHFCLLMIAMNIYINK